MITRRNLIASAALAGLSHHLAHASKGAYPNKPIRFIVPSTAGGGVDFMGRLFANELSVRLGQPVIVDNRDGAGGGIGAAIVAKSTPDGYTVLVAPSGTMSIKPHLSDPLPYDTMKDFVPVSLMATGPLLLFAHSSVPFTTVQSLVQYAKANPGKVSIGSAGIGLTGALCAEMFMKMAGVDLIHVPYRGVAPANAALRGGQVNLLFDGARGGMPHVATGQIRALANAWSARSSLLPTIPTIAEAGYPDFKANLWYGLYVRAGTPEPIIALLNAETTRWAQRSEVRAALQIQYMEAGGGTPAQFESFWRSDSDRWRAVIRKAKI